MPEPLSLTGKRITPRSDVLIRELHGESVLLDLQTESYFGLDEVGTRMWEALTAQPDFEAACSELLEAYDVEPGRLREDLVQFVEELAQAGLVDVGDV